MMLQDHNYPSSIMMESIMRRVNAHGTNPRVVVELDRYTHVKGVKQKFNVWELVKTAKSSEKEVYDEGGDLELHPPHMPRLGAHSYADLEVVSKFVESREKVGAGTYEHPGSDFKMDVDEDVAVTWTGEVTYAKHHNGYGNVIFVDHGNGVQTRYAPMGKILVKPGQKVSQGEVIGTLGEPMSKGEEPNLHYEVRKDGDPLDPAVVLKDAASSLLGKVPGAKSRKYTVKDKISYVTDFNREIDDKFIGGTVKLTEYVEGLTPSKAMNTPMYGFKGTSGTLTFKHRWLKEGDVELQLYVKLGAGDKITVTDTFTPYVGPGEIAVSTSRTLFTVVGTPPYKGLIYPPIFSIKAGDHKIAIKLDKATPDALVGLIKLQAKEYDEVHNKEVHWDFEDTMVNDVNWTNVANCNVLADGDTLTLSHASLAAGITKPGIHFPITAVFKIKLGGKDPFAVFGLDDGTNLFKMEFLPNKVKLTNSDHLIDNTVYQEYLVKVSETNVSDVYVKEGGKWKTILSSSPLIWATTGTNGITFGTNSPTGNVTIDEVKYAFDSYKTEDVKTELDYVKKEYWYELGDFVYEKTVTIEEDIMSWEVNNHLDMATATAKVNLDNAEGIYSPDYTRSAAFPDSLKESPLSFSDGGEIRHMISEYTPVRIYVGYGEQMVRVFTGMIKGEIEESSVNKTVGFSCVGRYDLIEECVLYEPLSYPPEEAMSGDGMYEMWLKSSIVQALATHAGMVGWRRQWDDLQHLDVVVEDTYYIDVDKGSQTVMKFGPEGAAKPVTMGSILTAEGYKNPFVSPPITFEIGEKVSDCISNIIDDIPYRTYCDRYGTFKLEKLDFKNNRKWTFRDGENLVEVNSSIDHSRCRNHLVITGSEGKVEHFFDQDLFIALKGNLRTAGIELDWIDERDTKESLGAKQAVADKLFFDFKRAARTKNVVVKGNPLIDIMDGCYIHDNTTFTAGYYIIKGNRLVGDMKGMLNFLELTWLETP